jgi:hypothetical protein
MYLSDVMGVLLRRWYILLVGLFVMGAATGVVREMPTNYQASGNVLLLLPPASAGGTPVNPYLNVQQGLVVVSSIIGGVVTTPEAARSVYAAGFTSEYSVTQTPGTGIPLLTVSAEDTDGDRAVATVREVIRRINAQLAQMQADVNAPAAQTMYSREFSVTTTPEKVNGDKIRALAVAVASIGLLTLLSAFGVDRYLRNRKPKKRAAARASGGSTGSGDVTVESAPPAQDGGRQRVGQADDHATVALTAPRR